MPGLGSSTTVQTSERNKIFIYYFYQQFTFTISYYLNLQNIVTGYLLHISYYIYIYTKYFVTYHRQIARLRFIRMNELSVRKHFGIFHEHMAPGNMDLVKPEEPVVICIDSKLWSYVSDSDSLISRPIC